MRFIVERARTQRRFDFAGLTPSQRSREPMNRPRRHCAAVEPFKDRSAFVLRWKHRETFEKPIGETATLFMHPAVELSQQRELTDARAVMPERMRTQRLLGPQQQGEVAPGSRADTQHQPREEDVGPKAIQFALQRVM